MVLFLSRITRHNLRIWSLLLSCFLLFFILCLVSNLLPFLEVSPFLIGTCWLISFRINTLYHIVFCFFLIYSTRTSYGMSKYGIFQKLVVFTQLLIHNNSLFNHSIVS